jgi:hypothetical protein
MCMLARALSTEVRRRQAHDISGERMVGRPIALDRDFDEDE